VTEMAKVLGKCSAVLDVLAKMSPEMLQAVTREILKPVVAAMIRDEINAKKS
jgi:hypothetical protein